MNEPTWLERHAQKPSQYQSYLLRLWRSEQCDGECWRASLQDSRTGERIGFANLEELFAFLMQLIESPGPSSRQ